MTVPAVDPEVPDAVRRIAGAEATDAVWRNDLGGVTFRLGDGRYVKHGPHSLETTMAAEAERLRWAVAYTPVPRVLAVGDDARHEWLVTEAVPALSAVDPRWVGEPDVAVRAIGQGLRAFHDALPVEDCPFDWSVAWRVHNAAVRGIRVPEGLREPPPIDRLVVCHGDACAPNTLLDDDGRWRAHVDLGALGLADRWADIAVAALSTLWNYGPGWESVLVAAYGVEPDDERMRYYRDLWNAT